MVPGGSVTVGGWSLPTPGFFTLLRTPNEGLQPFPQAGMTLLHWHRMAGLVGFPWDEQLLFCPPHPGAPAMPWAGPSLCHGSDGIARYKPGSCFNLSRINLQ